MNSLVNKLKLISTRLRGEQRGSAIVIIALSMVCFLGFLALVSDAGILYLNQSKLANAVDSAVMAGVQELPANPYLAQQYALGYGSKNGLDPSLMQVAVDADQQGMAVQASKTVNFFFAQVLGFHTGRVKASAKAEVAGVTSANGIAPLAIEKQDFIYGQTYTLKTGHGEYGWFGPLSLGGGGNSTYEDNMKYGYQHIIRKGDVLDTETGNMSGGTRRGIDYRISLDPHGGVHTSLQGLRDDPMVLIIPVIDSVPINQQPKTVQVVGFAAFLVDEVGGNGNDSIITGRFIRTVIPGDVDVNQHDYGVRGVKLIH